ncbi:MAG: DUF2924 domain-containing protein [Pseudomonadota bacterium]
MEGPSRHGGAIAAPLPEAVRNRITHLPDLDNAALKAAWRQAWGEDPPKAARKGFLMLGTAWRWQADHFGGFHPELARRFAALTDQCADASHDYKLPPAAASNAARPVPGTRLIRDWQGARHEVHVTEQGYLWRGRTYGSLSGVAKAITGVQRNGPAFFGLRRSSKKASS